MGGARDDAEPVVRQTHDRQVGTEPAVLIEDRGVDDPTDGDIHLSQGDVLDGVEGGGAEDVEDDEAREVDEPGALPHGEVFGVDDRGPPAGIPFGAAVHDRVTEFFEQTGIRLIPLRPLPTAGFEEHGPEIGLALPHRGAADVTVGTPLLAGVDDAIGLVECLRGAGAHVFAGALMGMETSDVGTLHVDLRQSVRHPLGHRPTDPGPSFTHTAAADHNPFTWGDSPRMGAPSGVRESRPLMA